MEIEISLTVLVSLATNPNCLDTVYCFLRVMLQWVVVGVQCTGTMKGLLSPSG